MPAIDVQSSLKIAASAQSIMSALVDFRTWPVWSPWLYTEPDATVNYVGNAGEAGHGYDWSGKKVGAGSMQLLSSDEHQMRCELTFLKPFKSRADVEFELQAHSAESTTVTWKMDSKLPFFMFFFKGVMTGMIRSDYNRGLLMLKDYIETGSVPSSTVIEGVIDASEQYYVGNRGESAMGELATSMEDKFSVLVKEASASSIDIDGAPMCFYHRMDIRKGRCGFTVALPTADPQSIGAGMESGHRPACKALKLVHTGAYRHLGNAWATIMGEARARKLKVNKQIVPFESYLNDPDTTDEKELITEVFLPVR